MSSHRIALGSLALFTMMTATACAAIFESDVQRCARARVLLQGGYRQVQAAKLDGAEATAQRALQMCPASEHAYVLLGQIYTRRQQFASAIQAYKTALQINPYSAFTLDALGYTYKVAGQYDPAIEALGRAIWADSSFVMPHINLGDIYEIRREPEKAEREYREAIRKRPVESLAYFWLANLYRKEGLKTQEAVALFKRYIELESESANPSAMLRTARTYVAALESQAASKLTSERERAESRPAFATGSGFIIDRRGYVLTNEHVVQRAKRVVVVHGRNEFEARIISADSVSDLALLKFDAPRELPAMPLGQSSSVHRQDAILTIGYPLATTEGVDLVSTSGRVAAIRTRGARQIFQVDVAVNPGSSGGPVLNDRGEVIGVIQGQADAVRYILDEGIVPEGIGWAIPISFALPLLAAIPDFDFRPSGRAQRLEFSQIDASAAPSVVFVIAVLESTPKVMPDVRDK